MSDSYSYKSYVPYESPVRGLQTLDQRKIKFSVNFPVVKFGDFAEIKDILKMVKKLKIGTDRPNFKPINEEDKSIAISPDYWKWDESKKLLIKTWLHSNFF